MKETTIEPYLPMLERFEEFFREELASRLSVEAVDSVMEAAVEKFHRISVMIPDVPPTSPWVKNMIGIAYEIGLWQELSAKGWSPAECSVVTHDVLGIRLTRTRTLAHGASCCDFRLTKKRGAADGAVVIRPEDLQEFTNNG